jgi:site-specific DNA-methyltransferase (adenine-specific)
MTNGQAGFALRGRNPDVLTCIANLSNDEVFTPPELANQMLDTLTEAWAADHDGADLWADPSVRFLDPFTKSGVFVREITSRLTAGLADAIPDLEARVDHILTTQVYGIAITHLTSLLARRSLYCSKWANGPHSIARSFDDPDGNIWFERTEHTWAGGTDRVLTADEHGNPVERTRDGRCTFCGASQRSLDRGAGFESHAYAFIHTDDIKARLAELFGDDMQFDVIVGNPPYQLASDGGTRDVPIYQHFVEQAKTLEPRYLTMVIPSRWMAAGLGLGDFRAAMLGDQRIRRLVDYPDSSELFPGVKLMGGACYFLWARDNPGWCETTLVRGGEEIDTDERRLDEFDILVRDSRALGILRKIQDRHEASLVDVLSADKEFGLTSNFDEYEEEPFPSAIPLYVYQRGQRLVGWISRGKIIKSSHLIDSWKVLIPAAGFESQILPTLVLSSIRRAPNPSACTQTYLFLAAASEAEADHIESYVRTRLFRFLVWLRKVSQHATRSTYTWVPQQTWDRFWTDAELYAKYGITEDEQAYVESIIRPMDAPAAADDG